MIQNMPDYAYGCKWIVARDVNGILYFWGAFDDEKKAQNVAEMIDGIAIRNRANDNK